MSEVIPIVPQARTEHDLREALDEHATVMLRIRSLGDELVKAFAKYDELCEELNGRAVEIRVRFNPVVEAALVRHRNDPPTG